MDTITNSDGSRFSPWRNPVINGDFDFWQRGASFSLSGTFSQYVADRWNISGALSSGSLIISQQPHTLGQTAVPGNPKSFCQIVGSSAATGTDGYLDLSQRIEGVQKYAGRTVTITGYARVISGTRKIGLHTDQYFGTGGSPSSTVKNVLTTQYTLTTTWTKVQIAVPIPSIVGKAIGTANNDFLRLFILLVSKGTDATYYGMSPALGDLNSDTIQLSHFSIVDGDATAEDDPFSSRPYQQEQALCQRYYERMNFPNSVSQGNIAGAGAVYAATSALVFMKFQSKRVAVTPVQSSSAHFVLLTAGSTIAVGSMSGVCTVDGNVRLDVTATGLTPGYGTVLIANNNSAFIELDAEL